MHRRGMMMVAVALAFAFAFQAVSRRFNPLVLCRFSRVFRPFSRSLPAYMTLAHPLLVPSLCSLSFVRITPLPSLVFSLSFSVSLCLSRERNFLSLSVLAFRAPAAPSSPLHESRTPAYAVQQNIRGSGGSRRIFYNKPTAAVCLLETTVLNFPKINFRKKTSWNNED